MATLTPTLTPRDRGTKAKLGGGGLPPVIRFPRYGGGDGGRDDKRPDAAEQLRRYRLGLMIGMVAVTMFFVAFTATYLFRHSFGRFDSLTGAYINDWQPVRLPLGLLIANTLLLGLSSVTMEKARREAFRAAVVAPIMALPGIAVEREREPWLPLTTVLGSSFVAGQLLAWRTMAQRGFLLASGPSSSFFYVLTALHGLHLSGGVVALLYALLVCRRRALERRRLVVDVTAWYWHFMGLLWLYLFALLLLTT